MEIIFDDDDLEPLIRDMPIGSPHSGAEGERLEASSQEPLMKPSRKRNAPAKKKKTVVPSTPSLFEALDASGAAASAETSSNLIDTSAAKMSLATKLYNEKELLSFYVSGHPAVSEL